MSSAMNLVINEFRARPTVTNGIIALQQMYSNEPNAPIEAILQTFESHITNGEDILIAMELTLSSANHILSTYGNNPKKYCLMMQMDSSTFKICAEFDNLIAAQAKFEGYVERGMNVTLVETLDTNISSNDKIKNQQKHIGEK